MKLQYHCYFIADNGKQYTAYANDIWKRLIDGESDLKLVGKHKIDNQQQLQTLMDEHLNLTYHNLNAELQVMMQTKKENKTNSYEFQKSRIEKIGIENIRNAKMKRLEKEYADWLRTFESNQKTIPGLKQLLMLRIDG